MDPSARLRLLFAVAASGVLHFSLLFTVQVVPAERPSVMLQARLLPGDGDDRRDAVSRARDTRRGGAADHDERPARTARKPETSAPAGEKTPQPAALDTPLVPDLTWYPTPELDLFPHARRAPQPVYPFEAGAGSVRGEVTLLLRIDENGGLHEVSVIDAQPAGVFEAAAVAAFDGVRFEPARKDGRVVRSRVLVRVAFEPGEPMADAGEELR